MKKTKLYGDYFTPNFASEYPSRYCMSLDPSYEQVDEFGLIARRVGKLQMQCGLVNKKSYKASKFSQTEEYDEDYY